MAGPIERLTNAQLIDPSGKVLVDLTKTGGQFQQAKLLGPSGQDVRVQEVG